jgi:hypothetical protein
METPHNRELTSAEIASLWGNYMNDSMSICVVGHFLRIVEDTEIKAILEYALGLAQQHVQFVTDVFKKEDLQLPQGFTNEDVNQDAPRLYSDMFFLLYMQNMGYIGMSTYSTALASAARADIREFYTQCVTSSVQLNNHACNVMLSKGIFIRAPHVSIDEKADVVTSPNFFTGFFGRRRPLNVVDVGNLFFNIQRNILGFSLLMGFSQVAKSEEVRKYMSRSKEIAAKHLGIFTDALKEDDLPISGTWDAEPTGSTDAPFSDKLMMFHTISLNGAGIGFYGTSLAASTRHDLSAIYVKLMAEIGTYSEDGARLMIDKGWLEQPPRGVDRRALSSV